MPNTLIFNLPSSIFYRLTLKWKFNLKFLWILSFVSIIFLLASYIYQINTVTSEGYLIQNYQKKINKLSEENKILEINSAQINSLGNIEYKIRELGFEKIGKIYYLQVLESPVVTK